MASIKLVLRTNKIKKDGKAPLALRVTKDRKAKYTFIGVYIRPEEWDKVNGTVKKNHANSKRMNNLIRNKLAEADDLMLEAEAKQDDYSARQITQRIKGKNKDVTYFDRANEQLDLLEKSRNYTTLSMEKSRVNVLRKYVGTNDLYFHEIDIQFLNKFKVYLLEKGTSMRTVMNYYVGIRTFFNAAIRDGLVDQKYYPFGKGKIQIRFPENVKIGLTEEEYTSMETMLLVCGTGKWHARNLFMFSFLLAGVRVSVVLRIKWSDIRDGRLHYTMGKNKKVVSLKMPDKAIAIINAYKDQKRTHDDFIFPEYKKVNPKDPKDQHRKLKTAVKKVNRYLVQIADELEIDKKMSMHIARHTFGNIAGDKISVPMLQKLYRHSHITTTTNYQGNFIHKSADDALDLVIGF